MLEILKPEGSVVSVGDLLAALQLDDPNQVNLFEGGFELEKLDGLEKNSYILIEQSLNLLMTLTSYDFEEVLSLKDCTTLSLR